jgi:hypothetical protein
VLGDVTAIVDDDVERPTLIADLLQKDRILLRPLKQLDAGVDVKSFLNDVDAGDLPVREVLGPHRQRGAASFLNAKPPTPISRSRTDRSRKWANREWWIGV